MSVAMALEGLHKTRISLMDLLLAILEGQFSKFYSHQLAFLCGSERRCKILDII